MPFINITEENHNYHKFAWDECFLGTQKRVRNSRGKRAISVRTTEVLLYMCESLTLVGFYSTSVMKYIFISSTCKRWRVPHKLNMKPFGLDLV